MRFVASLSESDKEQPTALYGGGMMVLLMDNTLQGSGQDIVEILMVLLICCLPILIGFGALGWVIYHNAKSRKTAVRLGESLGLDKISQTTDPMKTWYGGKVNGRSFAIKPIAFKGSHYFDGRRRPSAEYYLRIVMEVQSEEPLGIVVYRSPQQRDGAETANATFEETFPTIKNGNRLTTSARNAMLAFAQKGYETGLNEKTYRTKKGVRNLTLRDRDDVPEEQLSREVLPDAHVILAHDHPNSNLSPDELNNLLDEITAVVHAIE